MLTWCISVFRTHRIRETGNTAPKTLPLAIATAMEKPKQAGKGVEVETTKETTPRTEVLPAATRTELHRPTIPLPKIKPRQKPGNQPATGQTKAGGVKGFFRTAASVVVQPPVEEEEREPHEANGDSRVLKDCDAESRGNKASAPEEDVDMGV